MTVRTGLGIDAGGSATRWALADAAGNQLASGEVAALSGLMMGAGEGRTAFAAELRSLAERLPLGQKPGNTWFGMTGAGAGFDVAAAKQLASEALGIAPQSLTVCSDMAMLHWVHFLPGEGHVLYAGTGSYASFCNAQGQLMRVGGRGALLDDAGAGCWIGLQALRAVWRAEESAEPRGALAYAVFAHLGSDDWAASRRLIYGQALAQARGGIANITRLVAATQLDDAASLAILQAAGIELARLGIASLRRFGAAPVTLAGRVLLEIPVVQSHCVCALRAAFPGVTLDVGHSQVNIAARAAQMAACGLSETIQNALEP